MPENSPEPGRKFFFAKVVGRWRGCFRAAAILPGPWEWDPPARICRPLRHMGRLLLGGPCILGFTGGRLDVLTPPCPRSARPIFIRARMHCGLPLAPSCRPARPCFIRGGVHRGGWMARHVSGLAPISTIRQSMLYPCAHGLPWDIGARWRNPAGAHRLACDGWTAGAGRADLRLDGLVRRRRMCR